METEKSIKPGEPGTAVAAKPAQQSRTIRWGHIQMILGMLLIASPMITPESFPLLPAYLFGLLKIADACVTYVLRTLTSQPLE